MRTFQSINLLGNSILKWSMYQIFQHFFLAIGENYSARFSDGNQEEKVETTEKCEWIVCLVLEKEEIRMKMETELILLYVRVFRSFITMRMTIDQNDVASMRVNECHWIKTKSDTHFLAFSNNREFIWGLFVIIMSHVFESGIKCAIIKCYSFRIEIIKIYLGRFHSLFWFSLLYSFHRCVACHINTHTHNAGGMCMEKWMEQKINLSHWP